MKTINATTIAKLIEAHFEDDESKFLSYANSIAEAYEKAGKERKAKIIRSKIYKTYTRKTKVTLDPETICKLMKTTQHEGHWYKNGEIYNGEIHMHGNNAPFTDGYGNVVEWR